MELLKRLFVFMFAVWLTVIGQAAALASEESLEYAVKSAYLLKFGSFVEWPPRAFATQNEPFVIGVLGEDPFGQLLDQIVATHTVQGRPVNLRRFSHVDQVRDVHVLYIAPSEKARMPMIASTLEGKGILTVADAELTGAMVNFVVSNNRVRFDVDLDQAERAGLKVSSKLLNVARSVKTGRG